MNKIYTFYNPNVPVFTGNEHVNPYYSKFISELTTKDGINTFPSKTQFPSKVLNEGGLTYVVEGATAYKQFTTIVEGIQALAIRIIKEDEYTDGNGKIDNATMKNMHAGLQQVFAVMHETFGLPQLRYDKSTYNLMCVAIVNSVSKTKKISNSYYAFRQKSENRNAVRDVVLTALNILAYGGKQSDIRNAMRLKEGK